MMPALHFINVAAAWFILTFRILAISETRCYMRSILWRLYPKDLVMILLTDLQYSPGPDETASQHDRIHASVL